MKKVSIMGCGWFGFPLAKALVSQGYSVKGSTTSPGKFEDLTDAGVQPFLLKLGEESETLEDFLKSDILLINVPPGKSTHEIYSQQMQDLADQVAGSQIGKIIFVSSTSVYPNHLSKVVESDATQIKTPRSGITMLEIEKIWQQLNDKNINIIRFAGLYGPNRNPGRFLAGKTTNGGSNPVNMIHLTDCIGIVTELIESDYDHAVFNACAPVHPTRKEFYVAAASQFGYALPSFEPPHETGSKIVSSEKLVSTTGYSFIYPDPVASLDHL
ncbi:MAG: SDR family oxidoreductase [Bacteroidota bacterium]